ncbi:hypothetical protein NM688_g7283 [Phlebia brevispora]|uniref:Uncharacterized protein n=1 Tax=Phlebia brevispora TaxID=194682 RepID=A0ACC1S755_9APHY|nr:hypothetical protein NM688_g7283 [Phlebia brevispora]
MSGRKLFHLCDEEPSRLSNSTGTAANLPHLDQGPSSSVATQYAHQPLDGDYNMASVDVADIATQLGGAMFVWDERKLRKKVNIDALYCSAEQRALIEAIYREQRHSGHIYHPTAQSQRRAHEFLAAHKLDVDARKLPLDSRWSIADSRQWDRHSVGDDVKMRTVVYQCSTGYDTAARQTGKGPIPTTSSPRKGRASAEEWQRRAPYDHTGCLAHAEVSLAQMLNGDNIILRIMGHFEHNDACLAAVALRQLRQGATVTQIQAENLHRLEVNGYSGLSSSDGALNHRYNILPGDLSRLYRLHYKASFGINLSITAERNVHNWVDDNPAVAKPHIRRAVFHYTPRGDNGQHFKICIATPEMKEAAWKYCHRRQVVIDGTFSLSTSRLLVWVALGVDEANRGMPVAIFLFSAPTGNRATHAGYDTKVIGEIMTIWRNWMGARNGENFEPYVALTDTDPKERGGLLVAWKDIILLLCKFHVRQCWTNKRSSCLGKTDVYLRRYLERHFYSLEEALLNTVRYEDALRLIKEVERECHFVTAQPDGGKLGQGGLDYLAYLIKTWMPFDMWRSWSRYGREEAAKRLGVDIEGVLPTTNHLESLNRNFKHKFLPQWQHSGHRLRPDVLVYRLITNILLHIYAQHRMLTGYSTWRENRFLHVSGGHALQPSRSASSSSGISPGFVPRAWYADDSSRNSLAKAIVLSGKLALIQSRRPYEVWATCQASPNSGATRYWLTVHPTGAATCTCLDWLQKGGACKHLRAFKMRIESMIQTGHYPQGLFAFPKTAAEAEAVEDHNKRWYGDQYSKAITLPLRAHTSVNQGPVLCNLVADIHNATVTEPLLPPPSEQQESYTIELDKEAVIAASFADVSGDMDIVPSEHSDKDIDTIKPMLEDAEFNGTHQSNIRAIQLQEQQRVEHHVSKILPLLHGVVNTLSSDHFTLSANEELYEFRDTITVLSDLLDKKLSSPEHMGTLPSCRIDVNPSSAEDNTTTETPVNTSKRRPSPRSLSPERRQKQHKSHGTL